MKRNLFKKLLYNCLIEFEDDKGQLHFTSPEIDDVLGDLSASSVSNILSLSIKDSNCELTEEYKRRNIEEMVLVLIKELQDMGLSSEDIMTTVQTYL